MCFSSVLLLTNFLFSLIVTNLILDQSNNSETVDIRMGQLYVGLGLWNKLC